MAIRSSGTSGVPFGGTAGRPANAANGQPYFNGDIGRLELYTSSTGWQNIVQETPGVAAAYGHYYQSDNSGTFTVSGTNFVSGAVAYAIGTNGIEYEATTTTYNSLVQLTATFTNLSNAYEPYDIKIVNPSNLFGLLPDAFYINASPVWTTTAGSLGTIRTGQAFSFSVAGTDSDSTITYSSSNIPSWATLNSSTGAITGTAPSNVSSDTVYSFAVTISDGLNAAVSRTFSMSYLVSDGLTSDRAAANGYLIKQATGTTTDGLYWVKNSNINSGTPFQVYCDMNTAGGGWILLVNSYNLGGNNNWTPSNALLRNEGTPSVSTTPYSILSYGDYLKTSSSGFKYMLGASSSGYTRAQWTTNGGIFTANGNYSVVSTSSGNTNVSADQWLPGVGGKPTGFEDSGGVGQRLPWLQNSTTQGILTTYPGSGSWWGAIITYNGSSYNAGPWISGALDTPNNIWYWIR